MIMSWHLKDTERALGHSDRQRTWALERNSEGTQRAIGLSTT